MITRDALRRLAEFQTDDQCAISFYFQPTTPVDRSHRDEAILIKDLVRAAQQREGKQQRENKKNASAAAQADLDRLLAMADRLDGNHSRAKVIFACGSQGIWEEFDVPAELERTELIVNRRFHLRPLLAVVDDLPRTLVALTDRKRARLFDVWMHEARQVEDLSDELPRRGRSDGFAGYDGGHAERHFDNEALRHIKHLVERLLERNKAGEFDRLVFGCRDEMWSDIEAQLHPYLRQSLVGRFTLEVATATPDQVREAAEALLAEHVAGYQQGLLREVLGEAQRNGRGAIGVRRVLESLERGEVQALLLGDNLRAAATECAACGHVDTRTTPQCDVCGKPTREIEDVADALVGLALRNAAELVRVKDDAEFERAGNVAALLRFRADQNTPAKVAS